MESESKVLIIYTGGTIGMKEDLENNSFVPLDFAQLRQHVPEIDRFNYQIDAETFDPPIDSSDVEVNTWVTVVDIIERNYEKYDGFVILHGTDTMAYTASALSFMLENLNKPVIITGSQLPIGKLRTDGKENLISAIEMAGSKRDGEPEINEVAVYFGSQLMRGNRTHKYNTEDFDAIESANCSALADVGTHIFYRKHLKIKRKGFLQVHRAMEEGVAILKIFPGIGRDLVERILSTPGLKGVVLETYGSGNAPTKPWLTESLSSAVDRGVRVVNVTQCNKGFVEQGRYATSLGLVKAGVVGAGDMTTEAALTKLMYLLAKELSQEEFELEFTRSICGERTSASKLV